MPYVNEFGHVAHGRGGTGAFLDNVQFDAGGGPDWIDAGRMVYQHAGADGLYTAIYDMAAATIQRAVEDPASPAFNRGCNVCYGGGGVWAAWLDGFGLFSSTGLHLPSAYLQAVGRTDGAIAYKPEYHSYGPVIAQERDGAVWTVADLAMLDLQLLGERRAIWTDGNHVVQTIGLERPTALVPGAVYFPRAVEIAGEWWLCYYSQIGLVFHPFTSTDGYQVVPAGDAWPDVALLGTVRRRRSASTIVRVAWSITLGEAAGHVRWHDYNVAVDPRQDLLALVPTPPQPEPPEPEPPTPEAPRITITEYDDSGVAPMDCRAVAELSGGPADAIAWLLDSQVDATVTPDDLEHVYHLANSGQYAIGVKVSGPGGSDQTGSPRIVTVSPAPGPEPEPPEPPAGGGTFVSTIQLSEPSYLNWRYGGGQSLDPPTNPDDPNREPFEHGRMAAGPDETAQLFQCADGTYAIQSPNGRAWLSVQPDGAYQERPVEAGLEPGPWERFTLEGNVLTELSKEGASRAPVAFVTP